MNENEAIYYSSQLDSEMKKPRKTLKFGDSAKVSARILAAHLPARVDLQATDFSATFTKKSETIVPAFKVPVLRVTGAGDAWNAGNILGDAHGLSEELRLALGNVIAAYYISNPKGTHPTQKQLSKLKPDLNSNVISIIARGEPSYKGLDTLLDAHKDVLSYDRKARRLLQFS